MSRVNQFIREVKRERRLSCVEVEGEMVDAILMTDFERIAQQYEEKKSRLNPVSRKQARKNLEHTRMRYKVGRRANELCERCGKYAPLSGHELTIGNAHHKEYRSHGGQNVLSNYEWLCGGCHRKEHEGGAGHSAEVQKG